VQRYTALVLHACRLLNSTVNNEELFSFCSVHVSFQQQDDKDDDKLHSYGNELHGTTAPPVRPSAAICTSATATSTLLDVCFTLNGGDDDSDPARAYCLGPLSLVLQSVERSHQLEVPLETS
jgi:hypothetical protein